MNIKKVLEHNQELYSIRFDDYVSFEFKLLKIKEFNLFNKVLAGGNIPPFLIYEEIFNLCYIGAVEYLPKNIPIGYIISTGQLIYQMSGGESGVEFLFNIAEERQRCPGNSIYEHMKSVIFWAFSSICLKDIDQMTEKEFIRNFVAAENLLIKTKPEYTQLDLKSIYDELFGEKPKTKEKPEVVHDVSRMEQELGYWNVKDAEERFMQEEIERIKKHQQNNRS
jgi:hypothetical protein